MPNAHYASVKMDDIRLRKQKTILLFSSKANDIRNNHPVVADFEHFKEVLERPYPTAGCIPSDAFCISYGLCPKFLQFSTGSQVGKTSVVYGAYFILKSLPTDNPARRQITYNWAFKFIWPMGNEYQECFGIPGINAF